jgi:hypothetical protein
MTEDHASLQATALGWQTAFPSQELDAMGMPRAAMNYGLSKRELFAAMAMQGILSSTPDAMYAPTATDAVAHADALLKELAK